VQDIQKFGKDDEAIMARVLHLPTNTASLPSHTVRGLRKIGVDARGLTIGNAIIQSAEELEIINIKGQRWSPTWFWTKLTASYYVLKWIIWADVIHWYFDTRALPYGLDLKLIKFLNKPAVVEWLGSDIRIPEIEFADNQYYREAFHNGYEHQNESYHRSRQTQQRFAKSGFMPIATTGMTQYLQKDIFPNYYFVRQRLMLSDFTPFYPDPKKIKPLIVHAPSAPIAKGTPFVLNAINRLNKKYDFEFILLQGLPRKKALQIMQEADIFLDQFIGGHHGMATIEAMAYGKPVLCYTKPSLINEFPLDMPVVNANPDNLVEVLEPLLQDGKIRHEIGKLSRAYVEKYHDAIKLAHQLVDIYSEVIKNRRLCEL
jgi:glycosyltransferase involved in cell wall biosynthesis